MKAPAKKIHHLHAVSVELKNGVEVYTTRVLMKPQPKPLPELGVHASTFIPMYDLMQRLEDAKKLGYFLIHGRGHLAGMASPAKIVNVGDLVLAESDNDGENTAYWAMHCAPAVDNNNQWVWQIALRRATSEEIACAILSEGANVKTKKTHANPLGIGK